MLKSMTGFGRSEGETTLGKVLVESRSVNHRYFDINIKIPKRLSLFEIRIREMVRAKVSRGRIDVMLKLETTGEEKVQFNVDLHLAQQYLGALQTLKDKLQLKGDIPLELLAGAKDLITVKEEHEDVDPYWKEIALVLQQSLQDMDEMKHSEGESLSKDLRERIGQISGQLQDIKYKFPACLKSYQGRLRERIRSLLGDTGVEVDPSRFQQEVALLAERTDITEEIVRTESHLAQFATLFEADHPTGRKMDFLLQEIHREVNTISGKANDAEISQKIVEIKGELEKIREQVQNIE
jgi:uncharacterized protein (TIGR00255 family)